ncbi:MAG: hypothetical protein QM756_29360 [Polyangiaceae bacterium]
MSTLRLREVSDDRFGPLSLDFEPGLSSVIGDDAAALAQLSEVLIGLRRPLRGEALLAEAALHSSPAARAEVASLLAEEVLPPARDVAASLSLAFGMRHVTESVRLCLSRFGLQLLLDVQPQTLSPRQLRAVAFAAMLSSAERARAVVLHDPFALVPLVSTEFVLDTCRRLAQERCVVVIGVTLPEALRLGGRSVVVERGRLHSFGALAAEPPVTLWLRSPEAARFAAVLREGAQLPVDVTLQDASTLRLSGGDFATLSRIAVRAALQHSIELRSLEPAAADLEACLLRRQQGGRA